MKLGDLTPIEREQAALRLKAWLRELEIRDQEDREWRERHAAMEAAAKEAKKKASTKPVSEQDAVRAAIEPADERRLFGVLDAVRDLVSRRG